MYLINLSYFVDRYCRKNNEDIHDDQTKYTQSYIHGTSAYPLIGKTIGEYLDETTEKYPDREAVVFCNDHKRLTFAELRETVGYIPPYSLHIPSFFFI